MEHAKTSLHLAYVYKVKYTRNTDTCTVQVVKDPIRSIVLITLYTIFSRAFLANVITFSQHAS